MKPSILYNQYMLTNYVHRRAKLKIHFIYCIKFQSLTKKNIVAFTCDHLTIRFKIKVTKN